jgi:hypothetical protein
MLIAYLLVHGSIRFVYGAIGIAVMSAGIHFLSTAGIPIKKEVKLEV